MYSLDSVYYQKEFDSLEQLLDDVVMCGMDPNCEITRNGQGTGECVIDLIQF